MEIRYRRDLYKILPDNPITVEVGVAESYFSEEIVRDWKPKKHFLVDVWEHQPFQKGDGNQPKEWHESNYDKMLNRMEPYLNKVVILRGISWNMAQYIDDNSVDFISIDACHSYDCVKKDIVAYWPKLKVGGVITFHDYLSMEYGVNQAVHEFANANGQEVILLPENKTEDAGSYIVKK